MPTADSFVGMPFMWPTLRMHCPSTLQRHTITGGQGWERKVKTVGEGSPAACQPQCSWIIYIFVHIYVFMYVPGGWGCMLLYVCAYVHKYLCAWPQMCRHAQVNLHACVPSPSLCIKMVPSGTAGTWSPGLTSDQELPHPGILADNYGYYVLPWLYPMQGQGEVGMGTCWDHKQ